MTCLSPTPHRPPQDPDNPCQVHQPPQHPADEPAEALANTTDKEVMPHSYLEPSPNYSTDKTQPPSFSWRG